jgi:hypothetical protein
MFSRLKFVALLFILLGLASAQPASAQQKGQYVPGQYGLNAGATPDPGFTYANLPELFGGPAEQFERKRPP